MALTIYGQSGSRAIRALWMAEELSLDYTHDPITFAEGTKQPGYEKINPNRRVPSIVDGEFRLWESMAINLYLAKKAGGALAPKDLEEDALMTQWSFWAMTELEKTLLQALFHHFGMFELDKDPGLVSENIQALAPQFTVLNDHLADREYLLGDRFTAADLNVASVLTFAEMVGEEFEPYPQLANWQQRCTAREALARARAKA
ncbi:MAG: glutathione S-transferase family protein [Pseudomonadales bacterium]